MRTVRTTFLTLLWCGAGFAQSFTIGTFAGNGTSGYSGDGGQATAAHLSSPQGVAADAAGNVYIADYANNRVRKVSAGGIITTIAGNGTAGFSGDNGPATSAELQGPAGLAVDGSGNVYVADSLNMRIRRISNGTITTVAGSGTTGFAGDNGPATSASLNRPGGVIVDLSGNLYIADTSNYRVRKVSGGTITTFAGAGTYGFSGDGGPATSARMSAPESLALDGSGNLYIADAANYRVRMVSASTGNITTVAGTGTVGSSGDNGPAINAQLQSPYGVTVDASGNIYITDNSSNRVRMVSNGVINTVAGIGTAGFTGDGGPAVAAQLSSPYGIAYSGGALYVADRNNERVRKLTPFTPAAGGPVISNGGIVPVDSTVGTVQSGEWVSIYGTNLASTTQLWNQNFQTTLGGTSVTIDSKPAYMEFVSPGLVNVQVPNDTTTGEVPVVLTTAAGSFTSVVNLAPVAPAFLLIDGTHVAGIILRSNGTGTQDGGIYDYIGPTGSSLGYPTVAVQAGDSIELYGVGFGPTNPAVPAGQSYAGAAKLTDSLSVQINNVTVTPSFAGLSAAGLYQFNFTIPPGLGTGDVPLVATVGGAKTQPGVVISLQDPVVPHIQSVTLSPATVVSGGTVTATVALTSIAPPAGVVVSLSASNSAASVPATVSIPAGGTSATFVVTAGTGTVRSNTTVYIYASYNGTSGIAILTVTPPVPPPGNAQCATVGGIWNATEYGSITGNLSAAGEVDSVSQDVYGSGQVTITQNGCSIQYNPLNEGGLLANAASLVRTGTVSGNSVTVTGQMAVLNDVEAAEEQANPGLIVYSANVSSNVVNASGQLSGNVLTLNGTGSFTASGTFSYEGESGSYTFSVTSSTNATFDFVSEPASDARRAARTRKVDIQLTTDRPGFATRLHELLRARLLKALTIAE